MENLAESSGSGILRAMGNRKRLQMLFALRNKEMSVGELEKVIDLSQSALSQHLAVLRRENIVKTRRDAQTIYYSIKSEIVINILETLDKFYNNRYG